MRACNKNQGIYEYPDQWNPGKTYVGKTLNFKNRLKDHLDSVHLFNPETAALSKFSDDIEGWQRNVIADWDYVTGYSVAHEWQTQNGALPPGHRLAPRIPFSVGGEFSAANMVPVESVAALKYWGAFALSISETPDGDQFTFNPTAIDALRCGIWSLGRESVCRCPE
ncbi:GIY-YIG nuclease family protein [Streptomyces sp. NPDC091387]|uniref:GIY-YIG nuclease family protein n=1 Tax=Streptomyces sp. NPDC091387 TaxID=3365998 RepID=UPI00382B31F6